MDNLARELLELDGRLRVNMRSEPLSVRKKIVPNTNTEPLKKSASIQRTPFILGVTTTLCLISIVYAMWTAPSVDPESLAGESSSVANETKLVDAVSDHEKILASGDAQAIFRYLEKLNKKPQDDQLPSQIEPQRRRISAANRLIDLDTGGEYIDLAVQSRMDAAETLYSLDYVNRMEQPALAKLLVRYAAPFIESENRTTAKMARAAMMKFEAFEYSKLINEENEENISLTADSAEKKQKIAANQKQFDRVKRAMIAAIERFPNDPRMTNQASKLIAELFRDNLDGTLIFMGELHDRFKDHESRVVSNFAKMMYDIALDADAYLSADDYQSLGQLLRQPRSNQRSHLRNTH